MNINIKFRRFIAKTLTFGLLISNISINSLAKDDRYENFEGNFLAIDNLFDNTNVDINIEGNTRLNMLDISKIWSERHAIVEDVNLENYSFTVKYLNDVCTNVGGNRAVISSDFIKNKIKPNTKYTFIYEYELLENPYNEVAKLGIAVDQWGSHLGDSNEVKEEGSKGIVTSSIFTRNDIDTYSTTINFYNLCGRNTKWKISNIMIYEGDFNETNYIFHKGIKSVGELEDDYSISIKSQNKNIIEDLEYGAINDITGENIESENYFRTVDFIKVKPNSTLVYSNNGVERDLNVFYYDKYQRFLGKREGTSHIIDIPNDCYYIKYYHYTNNSEKLQLEYGNNISSYTEPKRYIQKVKLKEPLRGIPGGAKDRIIKKNNKWFIERNCGEILLDGTQEIYNKEELNGVYRFMFPVDNVKPLSRSICDKYPATGGDELYEHVRASVNRIWYYNLYSIEMNKEDVLEKFANNPTRVVYELAEPIYEPLNIDLSLPIYEGTTYISNDSIIPATMKVKVDRIINKSNEAVEEAISTPTLYNISIARMWVNQMPESLLKDEMQMRLSEIYNISDIQLDKKNMTSNLDLYIKSENMLSLSLNTNSITFEDFSGVEDLELNNAVNLTINSSLPYELNAYLATEIQNSDKSKIMDKSTLNIKESSESNYNAFNNTNEKLTLKDNNVAGNDIIHNLDLLLRGGISYEKDVYKTTIKFEAKQK